MPAGISSEEYLNVFDRVLKKLEDFNPEFILISAGFDAHEDDPLAQFNLKTEDYYTITKRILEASGQTFEESKPVFEVNLKHKLIKKLSSMSGKEFTNFSQFLFDYAVIAEGGSTKDPAKYLRQLDKYLG